MPLTYEQALKQARELRGFYNHAGVYVLVNLFLFLVDWLSGPEEWWFYWPLIGWGIGLTVHGLNTFIGMRGFGVDWEERKARELMERSGAGENERRM